MCLGCAAQYFILGMTGHVAYDTNGERQPHYWMWDLSEQDETFEMMTEIKVTEKTTLVSTERETIAQIPCNPGAQ